MMYHDLAYAWHRLDGQVQNAKTDPVWRSRHRSGPVRRLLTNPGVLDIFVAHSTRLWPRITHQLDLEPPTRSRAISHARFVHRDRARSIWRYGVELIFSSSRGACRVRPGDIHNAWDRHEPLKPSRTAPRGADLLRGPNSANSVRGLSSRVMRFGDRSSQKSVERASKAPRRAGGAIATLPGRC